MHFNFLSLHMKCSVEDLGEKPQGILLKVQYKMMTLTCCKTLITFIIYFGYVFLSATSQSMTKAKVENIFKKRLFDELYSFFIC